jgi:hypothetical protein
MDDNNYQIEYPVQQITLWDIRTNPKLWSTEQRRDPAQKGKYEN